MLTASSKRNELVDILNQTERADMNQAVQHTITWAMRRAQHVPNITPYGFVFRHKRNTGDITEHAGGHQPHEDELMKDATYSVLVLRRALRHFMLPGIGDGLTSQQNERARHEVIGMLAIAARAYAQRDRPRYLSARPNSLLAQRLRAQHLQAQSVADKKSIRLSDESADEVSGPLPPPYAEPQAAGGVFRMPPSAPPRNPVGWGLGSTQRT